MRRWWVEAGREGWWDEEMEEEGAARWRCEEVETPRVGDMRR